MNEWQRFENKNEDDRSDRERRKDEEEVEMVGEDKQNRIEVSWRWLKDEEQDDIERREEKERRLKKRLSGEDTWTAASWVCKRRRSNRFKLRAERKSKENQIRK